MRKLFAGRGLVAGLLAALAVALAWPAQPRAELAVGVGADWVNAPVSEALSLRYDYRPWLLGGQAMIWQGPDGTNGGFVADIDLARWPYDLTFDGWSIDVNFGAAYLVEVDGINGTRWNFSGRAALNLWTHFRVFFIHFSHGGKYFGIADNEANDGWNFLGLAYRF